jgi:hypothetical protein
MISSNSTIACGMKGQLRPMMGSRISVSIPSQDWFVRNVIGGVGRERRGQHRLDGADGPRHGAGTVPKATANLAELAS